MPCDNNLIESPLGFHHTYIEQHLWTSNQHQRQCLILLIWFSSICRHFLANAFGFAEINLQEFLVAMCLAISIIPAVEIVKFIERKSAK